MHRVRRSILERLLVRMKGTDVHCADLERGAGDGGGSAGSKPPDSFDRGKLTPRKFCPVTGPEVFDLGSQVPRKHVLHPEAKDFGEHEKLQVRDPAALILQTADGFTAGVPPKKLQLERKVRLGPALAQTPLAHLRADHVEVCGAVFNAATVSAGAFYNWKPYEPLLRKYLRWLLTLWGQRRRNEFGVGARSRSWKKV